MRISSHFESNCAPPLCYIPCLPKSKDVSVSGKPSPAAVVEVKPPLVQKIEAAAAAAAAAGGKEEDGTEVPVLVAPKSCLKRANCVDNSKSVVKANVRWMDMLGKDLTQVKEFEPSESGDSDDEDGNTCTCVIQ
ncbi:hypothetical protein ACP70R_015344 [Stipagrostis hirtigluma subsp. patula]